jgi:hypothetical protein
MLPLIITYVAEHIIQVATGRVAWAAAPAGLEFIKHVQVLRAVVLGSNKRRRETLEEVLVGICKFTWGWKR